MCIRVDILSIVDFRRDENMTDEIKAGLGWKPIAVVAVVVVAAVAGIFLVDELVKVEVNPLEVSAALMIDYGDGKVEWYNVTTVNNTIPGILAAGIGDGGYEMGRGIEGVAFVESIGHVKNNASVQGIDDTSGMWWMYSMNGTQAPVTSEAFAAKNDIAIVREGQTIELEFVEADGPSGVFEKTGISVTVNIDYGNGTFQNQTIITNNFTALGALEEAVGFENLDMQDFGWGAFVNGIGGVSTGTEVEGIDDTSAYYWLWYINDDYAMVGAGQYVLQDGDVMEWAFEESTWR